MKPNYIQIFKKRLVEAEVVTPVESESTLEKVLNQSKKLPKVLTKLLTTEKTYNEQAKKQLRELVSDIRCVSYKPTIFRIVVPTGNFFELKYDPTPMELNNPDEFKPQDSFVVLISGKKYNIANRSEYLQCLDYINQILKTGPITKEPEEEQPESPEGGEEAPAPEGGEEGTEELPEEEPEA